VFRADSAWSIEDSTGRFAERSKVVVVGQMPGLLETERDVGDPLDVSIGLECCHDGLNVLLS